MGKSEKSGVQRLADERTDAVRRRDHFQFRWETPASPINRITDKRMAEMLHVKTNLVSPSGFQPEIYLRES